MLYQRFWLFQVLVAFFLWLATHTFSGEFQHKLDNLTKLKSYVASVVLPVTWLVKSVASADQSVVSFSYRRSGDSYRHSACFIRRFSRSIRCFAFIPSLRGFIPSLGLFYPSLRGFFPSHGQLNPSLQQINPSFHFHTVAPGILPVTWPVKSVALADLSVVSLSYRHSEDSYRHMAC